MRTKLYSLAFVLVTVFLISCNNDDDGNAAIIPAPSPPAATGFTWTENGSSTVKTAASATFSTQFKTLIAKDAGGLTVFEINLDGASAATYTVGSTNAITYTEVNPYFVANSGNVVISSNANDKVTGTFQGTGNSAGITAVNGTFTDITVIP